MKFNFLLALFSYHTQILMEKYLYSKELESIKKSNRFRNRELFDDNLIDLASNDYVQQLAILGFALFHVQHAYRELLFHVNFLVVLA